MLASEADRVFAGSGVVARGTQTKPMGYQSVPYSGWTSSIVQDKKGRPHIGYTLYLHNADSRFRLANWDGKRWNDREVAHAGKGLYLKESSYTGLIVMDPTSPTRVVISSDVDPATGQDKGGLHEVYTASIGPEDTIKNITWEAVTLDSKVRNLRPMYVVGEGYKVLLWLRGRFDNFTDYNLDVVGYVLERP